MLTCREVTRLISKDQDAKLSAKEWLSVRLHLAICSGCTQFRRQIAFIRQASRRYRIGIDGTPAPGEQRAEGSPD